MKRGLNLQSIYLLRKSLNQLIGSNNTALKDEIIYKESRWNYKAKNKRSSASGLFQVLNSKEKDPIKQIDQGLKYINHRYKGCACTALAHHKLKGWY